MKATICRVYGGWVEAVDGPGSHHGTKRCLIHAGSEVEVLREEDGLVLLRLVKVAGNNVGTAAREGTVFALTRAKLDLMVKKFETKRAEETEKMNRIFKVTGLGEVSS